MTVVAVTSPELLAHAWAVRREVFVGEQGVTEAEEVDGLDELPTTHHVLALNDAGEPVGTARLLQEAPGRVVIGRVAVLRSARGSGVGARLMDAIESMALSQCADENGRVHVSLSAQVTAIAFYRRLGYEISSEQYYDARILHQDAHKTLTA